MENLIKESLLNNLQVKVFGNVVSDVKLDLTNEKSAALGQFGVNPVIVQVIGAKVQGLCIRLDKPKILVLPNNGVAADDCGFESDVKMWILEKGFETSSIEISNFNVDDLSSKKVIDITIKSIKYENGRLTGKAQVEINILIKYSQEVRFNVEIIANDGWLPVTSIDLAGYQIAIEAKVDSSKGCLRASTPLGDIQHCKNF